MTDRFEEAAEAFFGELARSSNDELRGRFTAMLREMVVRCAVEGAANPAEGIGQWSGGRISICDELMTRADEALARERGKANSAFADGFSNAPV